MTHDEIVQLYEETLRFRQTKLGIRHPDVIKTVHNLARTYHKDGRHEEVLQLYRDTLQSICDTISGESAVGENDG